MGWPDSLFTVRTTDFAGLQKAARSGPFPSPEPNRCTSITQVDSFPPVGSKEPQESFEN